MRLGPKTANFNAILEYKRPTGSYPWGEFYNICGQLHAGSAVQTLADFLKQFRGFKFRVAFSQIFSVPYRETIRRMRAGFRVATMIRPTSIAMRSLLWLVLRTPPGHENVPCFSLLFFIFCLLRFRTTKFVNAAWPSTRWNMETILVSLDPTGKEL